MAMTTVAMGTIGNCLHVAATRTNGNLTLFGVLLYSFSYLSLFASSHYEYYHNLNRGREPTWCDEKERLVKRVLVYSLT